MYNKQINLHIKCWQNLCMKVVKIPQRYVFWKAKGCQFVWSCKRSDDVISLQPCWPIKHCSCRNVFNDNIAKWTKKHETVLLQLCEKLSPLSSLIPEDLWERENPLLLEAECLMNNTSAPRMVSLRACFAFCHMSMQCNLLIQLTLGCHVNRQSDGLKQQLQHQQQWRHQCQREPTRGQLEQEGRGQQPQTARQVWRGQASPWPGGRQGAPGKGCADRTQGAHLLHRGRQWSGSVS